MENDIINEQKEHLSTHYGIKLNSKMEIFAFDVLDT